MSDEQTKKAFQNWLKSTMDPVEGSVALRGRLTIVDPDGKVLFDRMAELKSVTPCPPSSDQIDEITITFEAPEA